MARLILVGDRKVKEFESPTLGPGARVRILRQLRGMTQDDLEAVSGVTRQTISAIEGKPDGMPHGTTMIKLARGLGVSVGMIVGDVDVPGYGRRAERVAMLRTRAQAIEQEDPGEAAVLRTIALGWETREDAWIEFLRLEGRPDVRD